MDWFTILLAVATLILILRVKVNSAWLILGGAALGVAYKLVVR
jgi:chromate transporter